MADPSDLEITRACAEISKLEHRVVDGLYVECKPHPQDPRWWLGYNPLHDDAQNAALDNALCEHGYYVMFPNRFEFVPREGNRFIFDFEPAQSNAANRRRARALCVWKIVRERQK